MIKVAQAQLGVEEMSGIAEVLAGGWLGMGSQTLRFEEALARFLGAANVVAVNTGTSALHLAMTSLGIGPGDEVLVPSLTYVASFQAVSATGALPVACECDPETLLLDLDDAERRISGRTKAVVPVHYCGQPCDMDRLLTWRETYGLRVVEDAAHAFGSTHKGRKIGSFGDITCFSFDPIKVITCGDGGAITTTDSILAEDLRNRRLLGVDRESEFRYRGERKWQYDVPVQGYRYHLSSINAAIGLAQLRRIEEFIDRRRSVCWRYDSAFAAIPGLRTLTIDYEATSPFMYIVRVAGNRDDFMAYLKANDVETGIHYLPNHWHSFYRSSARGSLPLTDAVGHEIVTLPLHCCLTDGEVDQVIAAVRSYFNR